MSSSSDRPDSAPEHCPGTRSEQAGKVSACAGCPNQRICASGEANAPDPGIEQVQANLESVKHKILVLSGKGGVGKSTVTSLLARSLAAINPDANVGVVDIDICGPSQPRVLGVRDEKIHMSGYGMSPVAVDDNLSVVSVGFMLDSPDDAVIWRGPKKNDMIKKLLAQVDWGDLEYLIVDTPPGTSDEHLSVTQYLQKANLTGVVLVTTPQEVSLLDVRKEIDFCRKTELNIIGVVENMSLFICPNCKSKSEIFPPTTGGARQMCSDLNVPFLGSLPLDPRLARCCDEGKNFISEYSDSPAVQALEGINKEIIKYCRDSVKI